MSLPLPKFAVQLLRTVPPAPRPAPAPAPDSPPRPPSTSSSSGGSGPHSPSLEERIRSLDEKLNGSRILADAPDRSRLRHRLLEVDINEVKPSEVVRSLLAKRSVFDEDSERLEGAGRAPSPGASPRARVGPCTPRALRYPFPAHPPPPPPTPPAPRTPPAPPTPPPVPSTPPALTTPTDDPRVCPTTADVIDRELLVDTNMRRSSFSLGADSDSKPFERVPEDCGAANGEFGTPTMIEEKVLNVVTVEDEIAPQNRTNNYSVGTSNLRLQPDCPSIKSTDSVFVKKEVVTPKDRGCFTFPTEDTSARDVMDMLLKRVENYQENKKLESHFEKKCKFIKENVIKQEFQKQEDRIEVNSESKFDPLRKSDNHKNKEGINENHIAKELIEFEIQQNHLNAINSIKSNNLEFLTQESKNTEKVLKDRHIHNYNIAKFEKENIQFDKAFDKEKFTPGTTDKKASDFEKNYDDRTKTDKSRHSKDKIEKDKHDSDKEKSKTKSDKNLEKLQFQTDKAKVEKEGEKNYKDKIDKDTEKTKHIEEKRHSSATVISSKHEHRKKEKNEKEPRKDSVDVDLAAPKTRKEDKYKYDKLKKDSESRREFKKDSDSVKHRKSSRDESSRDISRKDSTDSSTSRTSHESSKVKEPETIEIKEDAKSKLRHCDLFHKHDNNINKELPMRTDIKEDKDFTIHTKNKCEIAMEHYLKSKGENIEKQRHYSLDSPSVDAKRKERLNSSSSLPPNIGHKRRMSSQDSLDSFNEDTKKCKSEVKIPERRNSKENRSDNKHKTTKFSKGHFAKILESKTKDDKKNQVKPPDEIYNELKESDRNDIKESKIGDKSKSSKKSPKEEPDEKYHRDPPTPPEGLRLDFLATLELRSSEEDERQRALKKEMKEKKRIQQLQQIQELQMQQDALQQAEFMGKTKDDKKPKCEDKKKEAAREKRMSTDRKSRDEKIDSNKRKSRKLIHSSDSSDSDEPKKHSIFDIVDDGPIYISMYDKVKARSCKNMQKQEEEKRQEKIKAKFSQLKQSRAKREEKKRSSWDEDSDSDQDRKKHSKSSMDNSTDDDNTVIHLKKREKILRLDYERDKIEDYFDGSTNEDDMRNKLSRKNSRTRIMSDSSDDEISKRSLSKSPTFLEMKKEVVSDSDSVHRLKNENVKNLENNCKKNSLLNLFGKSDSDDSKLKLNLDNDYKSSYIKSLSNDFSSENESISNKITSENRKKHKKKQRRHKSVYSDEETKIENSDTSLLEGDHKHKNTEKQRRHSKQKDKRKDKLRDSVDTDETRDDKNKLKREKKSVNNSFDVAHESISNTMKKEGKMEDIFGPLSDESDRDTQVLSSHKNNYTIHETDSVFSSNNSDFKPKDKEDNKRKKEKKRKEKRYFKEDDNSLDVDAVSKAIEARLFADEMEDDDSGAKLETLSESLNKVNHNDLKCMEATIISEIAKHDKLRKECKEKKKKKKKNKEDRQSRKEHHHFYHQEKIEKSEHLDHQVTDIIEKSPKTMLLDIPLPNDEQTVNQSDTNDEQSLTQSLPRLTDSPPIVIQSDENTDSKNNNTSDDVNENQINYSENKEIEIEEIPMPPPYETLVTTDISEVPLPKEPLPSSLNHSREDFLSNLNSDGDSCENAVRNITNSEKEIDKVSSDVEMTCKMDKKTDEKPRAIISQEETEDAVAALLGESFGGKVRNFSNYEETENNSTRQIEIESATIENENIPEEDAEEMRQAVQNLNASEMDVKPDTPVSDNDLLLIDTDTEEADEATQDAIEKLPINIIATNQTLNTSPDLNKSSDISANVPQSKSNIIPSVNTTATDVNITASGREELDVKIHLAKRENPVQLMTSTATPVITSWSLSNNKLLEPHLLNIPANTTNIRDKNEVKPTQVTGNIVQIKGAQPPSIESNHSARPILNPGRVSTPYHVINQVVRSPSTNMQPPTIKIPEPHILYQKPQGIVMSPRMSNDPRMQSPKSSPQREGMTSPRLTNVAILSSPQNLNTVGMASPSSVQQRSPGQVTVVRMQQPPLSPIQAMHMSHGARTMLSPNRPNSVLVQTQGTPIHFNRLPVTPVLTPMTKQINVNNIIQQNKTISIPSSTIIHQQKIGDTRKTEQRNITENSTENAKIILSPNNLKHSTNATVMAQNRLISMQTAMHVNNMSSPVHLNNKVLINTVSQVNDKRDIQAQKHEQINSIPFGSTPIIHVGGVNNSTASIIQTGTKSVTCNLQESNKINRSQGSNVIHSLGSQRILTPTPISNIIQLEGNKVPMTPKAQTVLSMATIRPPSFVAKLELSNSSTVATTTITNSPLLLKTTTPTSSIRISSKFDKSIEQHSSVLQNHMRDNEPKFDESGVKKLIVKVCDTKEQRDVLPNQSPSSIEHNAKCETDFEELLKDNTNEIKVTNDPEKKLEINVGKNITLITPTIIKEEDNTIDFVKKETSPVESLQSQPLLKNIKDEKTETSNNGQASEKVNELPLTENITTQTKTTLETITTDNANAQQNNEPKNDNTEIENTDKSENVDKTCGSNFLTMLPTDSEVSDNSLKNDENDSWSAKDINIESVIKKVDSLINQVDGFCNENVDINSIDEEVVNPMTVDPKITEDTLNKTLPLKTAPPKVETDIIMEKPEDLFCDKNIPIVTNKRGGRNIRGRKTEKNQDRVQTRQISKPTRGGTSKRGRGRAKVDKKIKNFVNNNANTMPGDVYDFHEDSGDETTTSHNKSEPRPRLILTIKSPLSGHSNMMATSTLSITQKDQPKSLERNKEEKSDDFISPSLNTRKSRRLQEKDVQRTTVDEVIEDVSKLPTRTGKEGNKKRSIRQPGNKTVQEKSGLDVRKSPRGVKRTRDRSLSDASIDSGDEKNNKEGPKDAKMPRIDEPTIQMEAVVAPLPTPPPQVLPSTPTPITKPPKKMISEMSAKLASVFEAAAAAGVTDRTNPDASRSIIEPSAPPTQGGGEATMPRRLGDAVPGALVAVGATEATDARVQSPALPHRPPSAPSTPSMHRPADRATPILIRTVRSRSPAAAAAAAHDESARVSGGAGCRPEGEAPLAAGGVGAVAAPRVFRGYAATASLPRGAHHPPHPPPDHHHLAKQIAVVGPQPHQHHPGEST